MDKTKLLRVVRAFAEFWLVGLVIVVLVEHFARHHSWGHQIVRSLLLAVIPGLLGALVEQFRKEA